MPTKKKKNEGIRTEGVKGIPSLYGGGRVRNQVGNEDLPRELSEEDKEKLKRKHKAGQYLGRLMK